MIYIINVNLIIVCVRYTYYYGLMAVSKKLAKNNEISQKKCFNTLTTFCQQKINRIKK